MKKNKILKTLRLGEKCSRVLVIAFMNTIKVFTRVGDEYATLSGVIRRAREKTRRPKFFLIYYIVGNNIAVYLDFSNENPCQKNVQTLKATVVYYYLLYVYEIKKKYGLFFIYLFFVSTYAKLSMFKSAG